MLAAKQAQLQAPSTAHHVRPATTCMHLLPSACACVPQVSSLVAEVAAKQAQLQALEAEREALTAKARALDQLVASAGEDVDRHCNRPVLLLLLLLHVVAPYSRHVSGCKQAQAQVHALKGEAAGHRADPARVQLGGACLGKAAACVFGTLPLHWITHHP